MAYHKYSNTGTPQEMHYEDKEWNPTTPKDDAFSCLMSVLCLGIVFLIAYILC